MEAQKKECSLDGEHGVQPFLSEDREYVTMTAKLAAQWSISVGLGRTEEILKYSKDWAEFSGKCLDSRFTRRSDQFAFF